MVTPNVPAANPPSEPVAKLANELVVGDGIDAEFLPFFCVLGLPAEVLYLRPFTHKDESRIFVAFAQADGYHDSMTLLADAEIRVTPAPAAEVAGHGYGRGDEGQGPQQIGKRIEPHFEHIGEPVDPDECPAPVDGRCLHADGES